MINRLLERVMPGRIAANASKLFTGSLVARLTAIATLPILSRLYTPEDFGLFQLLVSIAAAFVATGTLSYHAAIVIAEDDEEARSLLLLSVLVTCMTTLLATIAIISPFSDVLFRVLKVENPGGYRLLLPPLIFSSATLQALQALLLRRQRYRQLAAYDVVRSFVSNGGALLLSVVLTNFMGLLSAYVASFLIVSVLIVVTEQILRGGTLNRTTLIRVASKYKKFPLFETPSLVANTISNELPVYFLSVYQTADHAPIGLYMLALRVMRMPLGLITTSVSQAYFEHGAALYREAPEKLASEFVVVVRRMALGLGGAFLLGAGLAPWVMAFVFGKEWVEAGVFVQILAFWLYSEYIYNPISATFRITQKVDVLLGLNVALLAVRFVAMYLFRDDVLEMLWALSLSSAGMYVIYIGVAYTMIRRGHRA